MARTGTDPAILDFIRRQPAAVREAARRARAGRPAGAGGLLAFGYGTSYHAALLAGERPAARVEPAYEVWTFGTGLAGAGRTVAVSHSGETAATLRAVERARAGDATEVVAVTCAEGSNCWRVTSDRGRVARFDGDGGRCPRHPGRELQRHLAERARTAGQTVAS